MSVLPSAGGAGKASPVGLRPDFSVFPPGQAEPGEDDVTSGPFAKAYFKLWGRASHPAITHYLERLKPLSRGRGLIRKTFAELGDEFGYNPDYLRKLHRELEAAGLIEQRYGRLVILDEVPPQPRAAAPEPGPNRAQSGRNPGAIRAPGARIGGRESGRQAPGLASPLKKDGEKKDVCSHAHAHARADVLAERGGDTHTGPPPGPEPEAAPTPAGGRVERMLRRFFAPAGLAMLPAFEGFDEDAAIAALKRAALRNKSEPGYALQTLLNWQAGEPYRPGPEAGLDDDLKPIAAAAGQVVQAGDDARRALRAAEDGERAERRRAERERDDADRRYHARVSEAWEQLGDEGRARCLARHSGPLALGLAKAEHARSLGILEPGPGPAAGEGGGA